jgi:hypothetical protein
MRDILLRFSWVHLCVVYTVAWFLAYASDFLRHHADLDRASEGCEQTRPTNEVSFTRPGTFVGGDGI